MSSATPRWHRRFWLSSIVLAAALGLAACGSARVAEVLNDAVVPAPSPPQLVGALAGSDAKRASVSYEEVFVSPNRAKTRVGGAWGQSVSRRQLRAAWARGLGDDLEVGLLFRWSDTGWSSPAEQASDVGQASGATVGLGFLFRRRLIGNERFGLVWSTEIDAMQVPYRRTVLSIEPDEDAKPTEREPESVVRHYRGEAGVVTSSSGLDLYENSGPVDFVGGARVQLHPFTRGWARAEILCVDQTICGGRTHHSGFFDYGLVGLAYAGAGMDLDPIELHLLAFGTWDFGLDAGLTAPGATLRVGVRY